MQRRPAAGFTLLEILAALVVLGLLMAGLSQAVGFGLRLLEQDRAGAGGLGELEAVDRLVRRLIEHTDPGSARDAVAFVGAPQVVAFRTDLGAAAAALATREADVRLSVEGGRLLLRWVPYLHAANLIAPPQPRDTELLRGLARLEIAYWDRGGNQGTPPGWQGEWRERADLPALVRVRFVFPAGTARRWPDIVAAPMRDRAGS